MNENDRENLIRAALIAVPVAIAVGSVVSAIKMFGKDRGTQEQRELKKVRSKINKRLKELAAAGTNSDELLDEWRIENTFLKIIEPE